MEPLEEYRKRRRFSRTLEPLPTRVAADEGGDVAHAADGAPSTLARRR